MSHSETTQPIDLFAQLDEAEAMAIGYYEEQFLHQKSRIKQIQGKVGRLLCQLTAYQQPSCLAIGLLDDAPHVLLRWNKPGVDLHIYVYAKRTSAIFNSGLGTDSANSTTDPHLMDDVIDFLDYHFKLEQE